MNIYLRGAVFVLAAYRLVIAEYITCGRFGAMAYNNGACESPCAEAKMHQSYQHCSSLFREVTKQTKSEDGLDLILV